VFLEPYQLGYSDEQAEPRRLVDRYPATRDVNRARDIEPLLATQPSKLRALTARPSAGRDASAGATRA